MSSIWKVVTKWMLCACAHARDTLLMEGGVAPVYSDFVAEEKRPTTEEITGKHTCQRTGGKGDVRAVQAEEAA